MFLNFQKQPSTGVLRKMCSENMQEIYKSHPCLSAISIKLQSNWMAPSEYPKYIYDWRYIFSKTNFNVHYNTFFTNLIGCMNSEATVYGYGMFLGCF